MKRLLPLAALLLVILAGSSARADAGDDADPELPEKLGACTGCHGPAGVSPNVDWPSLAGMPPEVTAKQLDDYRTGERSDPFMSGVVSGLRDEDVDTLAEWFATQPSASFDSASTLIERGRVLYMGELAEQEGAKCVTCHGADAEGKAEHLPGGVPALAGQQPVYTVQQLELFSREERTNDYMQFMRRAASRLSDEDRAALGAYLSGTPPTTD